MQKEIHDFLTRHLNLLVSQTQAYTPFIKNAFPNTKMSEACFNLMVGNTFSVFLSQYAMRMQTPSQEDFADFGSLVAQYKSKIEEAFGE